jgi:hypothetical protein
MIRLSRMASSVWCTCLAFAVLTGVGCAQNGTSGGTGGATGTGGAPLSSGGSTDAGFGGVGGAGGASTCPATLPANGDSCTSDLQCSYGSQTCCGVSYATETAFCLNGKFSVSFLETPCQLGGCGGAGGAGGTAGAGGAAGGNAAAGGGVGGAGGAGGG